MPTRQLRDLRGVGRAMLQDLAGLGIASVEQLARQDATDLYVRMCQLSGQRQDPCVHDVFRCAIEQARDPRLPREQRDWRYWSNVRKQQRLNLNELVAHGR
jgi:nucleotidyltransferase/DNA polymerase involved in DNA repair